MSKQPEAHPRDPECIFCKILDGDIPAALIFEDTDVFAFMDSFPASEGHALVIPKGHYADIHAIPESALLAVARAAQCLAAAQRKALAPNGITINQFNGAAAGQTVFHYHVHLIPRWQGHEHEPHGRTQGSMEELQALAKRIRAAL